MHKRKLVLFIILALIAALVTASCGWCGGPFSPDLSGPGDVTETSSRAEMHIRFFDVGQGDSILFAFPDGAFMLIDAGVYNNPKAVTERLDFYEVEDIEYVLFTHFDADHIGAAAEVINGYGVKNVIMPDAVATTKTFENLLHALETHEEINVIEGRAGLEFECGGAAFEVLSPFDTEGKSANETSVVTLMTYGDVKMLFMGDAEKSNETAIINTYGAGHIKADLIKIGHHGSATSGSVPFLSAVSPGYAVISCGKNNPYGHPAAATLETLERLGIPCFRTDIHGEVTAKTDGLFLTIETELP